MEIAKQEAYDAFLGDRNKGKENNSSHTRPQKRFCSRYTTWKVRTVQLQLIYGRNAVFLIGASSCKGRS